MDFGMKHSRQSLASRLARGEESAFAELYDAAADRLYRFLTARLGSRDSAADVLQTTFLRVVEKRRHFARVENPVAYLFRVASNEASRAMSRTRRTNREQMSTDNLASDDRGLSQEDAEIVTVALETLDPSDRELIELKVFAGLTFREIAETLEQPPGTVATRYRRALESLRPWLTKQLL
jgi:RNA polymerase sigma-70 factor (ECF subfamily)